MLKHYGGSRGSLASFVTLALLWLVFSSQVQASIGDRLPEFRECVQICEQENCGPDGEHTTPIPLLHRLLLWTCPQECDHTCQSIITTRRVSASPPQPIVQFHGKWPFHRLLGMQEPLSVLCSAGNLWAHHHGLHTHILPTMPPQYPMRRFYVALARIGMASWAFSMLFHTRDFPLTEKLDYFAAGASVLYGMYYAVVRIFGLAEHPGRRHRRSGSGARGPGDSQTALGGRLALPAWTALCLALYAAHVGYLSFVRWDYTYNMAANVACGAVQHALWSWHSWRRWRETGGRPWAAWPGIVVAVVLAAMSLELFDFPPLWGVVDAHGLWHLGTIAPTVLWYNFLAKDAQYDLANSERLKD